MLLIHYNTKLKTLHYEREANLFAAEYLLPEELPSEYAEYSLQQIAMLYCVTPELVQLKYDYY